MHICSFLYSTSGGSRISRWGGADPLGGRQPPMRTLFCENVCENERNGSCWGGGAPPWIRQWVLSKFDNSYHLWKPFAIPGDPTGPNSFVLTYVCDQNRLLREILDPQLAIPLLDEGGVSIVWNSLLHWLVWCFNAFSMCIKIMNITSQGYGA